MKVKTITYLLFLFFTSKLFAFDMEKVDFSVKEFVNNFWEKKCKEIDYSYIYTLYAGQAYEKGFYAPDTKLSDFNPAILPTDVDVKVKTEICGRDNGYYLTLRKIEAVYKVISYSAFSQPE